MRYLLDTSAILAHFRREHGWEAVQTIFEADDTEIFAASISLAEFGRRLRDLGATQDQSEETITSYQLLFDEIVAIDAALARATILLVYQMPKRLPFVDALIAAAAQDRQAVLVHRDEHMRHIPATLIPQQDLL